MWISGGRLGESMIGGWFLFNVLGESPTINMRLVALPDTPRLGEAGGWV